MNKLVENILKTYGTATLQEQIDGLRWYKQANTDCKRLAKAKNITLRHAVGVVAATSPNLKWEKNIHTASQIIDGHTQGIDSDKIESCMAYKQNRTKAYSVLDAVNRSTAIMKVLNGPKVSAFFDNIMGGDSVTVDGHARNIAYGERINLKNSKVNISKKEYATIAQAYRDAAAILGMKACDLQAITWCAWRRQCGIK